LDTDGILKTATEMITEGADILDVGAYSSRPGSDGISAEEEMQRLDMALEVIRGAHPDMLISVDTFRPEIASRVVNDFNVDMINDISGGDLDPEMFNTIAGLQVPYVMMHMKGKPSDMQEHAKYTDVVKEIIFDFSEKLWQLNMLGVNDIIIDPGFGFAKTIEHNYQILRQLEAFHIFNQPLMAGLSRKSMIYRILGNNPSDALNGSTVLHTIALMKGANILRVHDVKEACETIKLVGKTFIQ
jgi:dihydropteroate synthase